MAPMKEQIKTPGKELNKMETHNLPDSEFTTLVIRQLKEPGEKLSHIKQPQSEAEGTLTGRTIYRETTVKWMKPRIKSMTWDIRKQKTTT